MTPLTRLNGSTAGATVEDPDTIQVQLTLGVVGLGYVGLPTAISFLTRGHEVVGFDVSEERLAAIRSGDVDLLPVDHERLAAATNFRLTSDAKDLQDCDAVIIAVPTPVDRHLVPDLSMLTSACKAVVENATADQVVILTSTTYAGTTADLLVGPLTKRGFKIGAGVHVAFSPERIDPASTTFHQDDVPRVVGGVTDECARRAKAVLSVVAPSVHVVSSPEAAELTKLMENTFRAVNISLANEFADISRALGIDPIEVIEAAATKPFGFMPFYPGPGIGGHCIPCDPRYLQWQLRPHRTPTNIIDSAMEHMIQRPVTIVRRVAEVLAEAGRSTKGAKVLVVGVAYKPNVQDVRESPALDILELLVEHGIDVDYYDPLVTSLRLNDGSQMKSTEHLDVEAYDLVLAHTLHAETDIADLARSAILLDATFRLPATPNRVLP